MSGFLHKLAQRTLRSGPPVHSRARLPYAELPVLTEPADLHEQSESALQASENRDSLRGGRHDSGNRNNAREISDWPPIPGATRIVAKPERSNTKNHGPPKAVAEFTAYENNQGKSMARSTTVPAMSRDFVPLVRPAPDANWPERIRGDSGSETIEVEAIRAKPGAAARRAGLRDRSQTENRLDIGGSPGEPVPEVHISIGRVEVTAAAPAPKRSPVPACKTMPLEEYLERRGRGER